MKNIKELGKIEYSSRFNNIKYYNIVWEVTSKCSYNCKYCNSHNNNIEYKDKEFIDKIIDKINIISNFKKNVYLDLFGGEPTQQPNFLYILEHLNIKNIKLSTNLNVSYNYLKDILSLNKCNIITVSYHPEKIKNDNDFINKILYIKNNYSNIDLCVHLMLEKGYEDRVFYILNILNDISCLKAINYNSNDKYFDQYKEIIKNNQKKYQQNFYYIDNKDKFIKITLEDILLKDFNKFYFYECDVKKYKIYIDTNGFIYPCYVYSKENRIIDNIINNNFNIYKYLKDSFNTKFICQSKKCLCDLKFTKKRILNI